MRQSACTKTRSDSSQNNTGSIFTYGLTACFCPLQMFAPQRVTRHYALKLDNDSLVFHSARNDCCCHIAESQQTLPLDKIQDVQLQGGCLQTCFGLKDVRVQTAGVNQAGTPDVATAFLAYPEKTREAIQLAVRLSKKKGMAAPQVTRGSIVCETSGMQDLELVFHSDEEYDITLQNEP